MNTLFLFTCPEIYSKKSHFRKTKDQLHNLSCSFRTRRKQKMIGGALLGAEVMLPHYISILILSQLSNTAPDWPKWPVQLTYDLCTFFDTSPCPTILCIGCRAVPEDFMRLPGTVLTVISFLLEVHSLPEQIGFDQIITLVWNTQRFMSYARTSGGNNLAVCRAKWAHIQYVQLVINFASAPELSEIKNWKAKEFR